MKNLKEKLSKEEYNQIPVYYCDSCLSLAVQDIDGIQFCKDCGEVVVNEASIEDWEMKYKNKYGVNHLNNNKK